ncbi:MAG: SDR family oxidoreductase, partial [Thermoanaerobaculia bacterium]
VWQHNPLSQFSEDRYIETMRINVSGPFYCMREALPFLRLSKQASVINITSTAGQRGEAFYSPYAASKGAMISATKAWAVELAPDIRVNSVAPGWVDTEMSGEPLHSELRGEIDAGIPLGRVASADDVAGPILFLASPLARHVTGEILNVNGGSVLAG